MAIDTRNVNDLGAAKFRTQAENKREQICYYNQNKKGKSFNSFLAVRKQTSQAKDIIFSIVSLIEKTNRNRNIYFEINDELSDFNNDNVQYKRPIQRLSESELSEQQTENISDNNDNIQLEVMAKKRVSKKSRFLSR